MRIILLISLSVLFSIFSHGQDFGEIVCPLPNDTVVNGELLIVFRINPGVRINPGSIDVIIDRVKYNPLMKSDGHKITVLIRSQLKKGLRKIIIRAKDQNKNTLEQSWIFYLLAARDQKDQGGISAEEVKTEKPGYWVNVNSRSKFTSVTGEGAGLRQEPQQSHDINLNAGVRIKNFEIPLKIYYTNHENKMLPPRNRFFTGIKSKAGSLYLGDINPVYHPLILNSARIRGIEGSVYFRSVRFSVIYGSINRASEGAQNYYNSLENAQFPPINLQTIPPGIDSVNVIQGYYNDPGTYKRNVIAGKLSFGSPNTHNWFHLVFLKSTDDTNSIQFGGPAAQNFTFGFDVEYYNTSRIFKLRTGLAAAFTTRDIRNGVASEEHIESIYNVDLPFNPENIKGLLIVNSTTNPPSFDHVPFLSYYIEPEWKTGHQKITAQIRRIGSDYTSFGNPYLINDRLILSLADRLLFLKNRLYLSVRLKHFIDNLAKQNLSTQQTYMADASFNYRIKQNFPAVSGGYRIYSRQSKIVETNQKVNQYQISNYRIGLIYPFSIGQVDNDFSFMYNFNERKNFGDNAGMFTNIINLGFSQHYSFGLLAGIQYNLMMLTNDTSSINENNTYSFNLGYRPKNNKYQITFKVGRIYAIETILNPECRRSFVMTDVGIKVYEGLELSFEAGTTAYRESAGEMRDYDEVWGQFSIRYNLKQ